jgi:hypothetical protein
MLKAIFGELSRNLEITVSGYTVSLGIIFLLKYLEINKLAPRSGVLNPSLTIKKI